MDGFRAADAGTKEILKIMVTSIYLLSFKLSPLSSIRVDDSTSSGETSSNVLVLVAPVSSLLLNQVVNN
jgi:hypothetical protein